MIYSKDSIKQEGVIIDIKTSSRKSNTFYRSEISYTALGGKTYTFLSKNGTGSSYGYSKRDKIMTRYNKEQPQIARIDSLLDYWSQPLALLLACFVILLSGSHIIYNRIKRRLILFDYNGLYRL